MPNVAHIREELKNMLPLYKLIRDCIEGEPAVKRAGDKYLPRPNPVDISPENQARYKAYLERALFYNITQRTLYGLAGQIFTREPVIEIPSLLDPVAADGNGGGVDLVQLAKRAVLNVLAYGRSGILVDYPITDSPASLAEIDAGEIRPTINIYHPTEIINWRTVVRGARELLSLIVLQEDYIYSDDGFEMKKAKQWRVLQLTEEGYAVTIWRFVGNKYETTEGPFFPKDASGKNFTEIPFTFIGSENNDDLPDLPPLYDLASLNIGHYRNSADFEEGCYFVGQPTPVLSGLTEEWVKGVLKGTVALGSRGAILLPEGGSADLLQAAANTMPFEAMQHKERQMVALGAKLVQEKKVQRTATEANIENISETSILASSAKNVSVAFKKALEWCAFFVGVPETGIKFELHTDFDLAIMAPQERAQLIAEWQAGAITFEEMRDNMRRAGIAKLDDAEAKTRIAEELASAPNLDLSADNNQN